MCNRLYLLLRIEILSLDPTQQFRPLLRIRLTQGIDQQEGLLVAQDVTPDMLSKGAGIAIDIQQVVLQLESQADVNAEGIQPLCISRRSST